MKGCVPKSGGNDNSSCSGILSYVDCYVSGNGYSLIKSEAVCDTESVKWAYPPGSCSGEMLTCYDDTGTEVKPNCDCRKK